MPIDSRLRALAVSKDDTWGLPKCPRLCAFQLVSSGTTVTANFERKYERSGHRDTHGLSLAGAK